MISGCGEGECLFIVGILSNSINNNKLSGFRVRDPVELRFKATAEPKL